MESNECEPYHPFSLLACVRCLQSTALYSSGSWSARFGTSSESSVVSSITERCASLSHPHIEVIESNKRAAQDYISFIHRARRYK